MEKWQVDYITENLVDLIGNTVCSVEVKSALLSYGILSDEDIQNLSTVGRQESRIAEAKALYDLLMTRDDGYSRLMEVLEFTRQSGALKILRLGDPRWKSVLLTSMAEELMDWKVNSSGNVMKAKEKCPKVTVKDAFPNMTVRDVAEILENAKARKEFQELKSRNVALELGPELPEICPLYIPRRISNRVELDPEIFRRDCPDIFVFRGLSKNDVRALVAPHWVVSSTDQLSLITCRHICLDDEEDWDDLAQRAKAPLHLIAKEVIKNKILSNESKKEIYILAKSTEASPLLQEASQKMPERSRDMYISEEQFVDKLLSPDSFNGACLCDVPGMGKSWLLQSLTRKLRDLSHNSLVFYTNLSSFSEYLEQTNATRNDDTFFAFLNHVYSTTLAAFLMYRHVTNSDISVYLFLDGYDEILDSRRERTNSMLQSMHSSQSNVKMIITSRPNMRGLLEVMFVVISYDILPFDTGDQISAMSSIWQEKFPKNNTIRLTEYAAYCAKITKNIKASNHPDILGVPLKCYLLAIVNEKNARQFSDPTRKKQVKLSELAISTSVFDLYQEFVNTMLKKLEVAEERELDNDSWRESVLYYHTLHALNLLYPEIGTEFSAILPEQELSEHELKKVGMLSTHGSKMTFIHRTFAEYFVGRFVADSLTSGGQETNEIVIARKAFFTKLLCTNELRVRAMESTLARFFTAKLCHLKIYKFTETTVLWFMDRRLFSNPKSSSFSHKDGNNLTNSRNVVDTVYLSSMWPLYLDAFFKDRLFQVLLCCIREEYHHVVRLIMQIRQEHYYNNYFSRIFRSKSASNLLTRFLKGSTENLELAAVCILLDQLAQQASEETAYEIYNFFTQAGKNCFREIFNRSSSALKYRIVSVACTNSDYNKSRDWFPKFLNETKLVEKSELPIIEFLKVVAHESKSRFEDKLDSISLAIACNKWTKIKSILLHSGINLQSTSLQFKAQVMDHVLSQFTDSELVVVLLDLFGEEEKSKKFWATQNINQNNLQDVSQSVVGNVRLWKAEEVLQAIDMKDANHVLAAIKFELSQDWIYNATGFEIFYVLHKICDDMRNNPFYDWDDLTWAVWHGNVERVRHLLEKGHDGHAIHKYGRTLLHFVTYKCPLKITELLLKHGANVYAVDQEKNNVVHSYYIHKYSSEKFRIVEWTNFMLDRGHHKLWSMKNSFGKTPMDLLAEIYDVTFCDEIASLVKKYEAMSQEKALSPNESGTAEPYD